MSAPKLYTQEDYLKLAEELIEWAKDPASCHLCEFTGIIKNKSRRWLYEMAEVEPIIKEALAKAKEILATKYFRNGLSEKWNANLVGRFAWLYDSEVKEMVMASQKMNQSDSDTKTININIQSFKDE